MSYLVERLGFVFEPHSTTSDVEENPNDDEERSDTADDDSGDGSGRIEAVVWKLF